MFYLGLKIVYVLFKKICHLLISPSDSVQEIVLPSLFTDSDASQVVDPPFLTVK